MRILLTTIWHTGSEYARKQMKDEGHDVFFRHCDNARVFDDIGPGVIQPWKGYDEIHTTFRDPHLVAASWANRYDLTAPMIEAYWFSSWPIWRIISSRYADKLWVAKDFKGPPVNETPDRLGVKAAYLEGRMEDYYKIVPHDWVQFALKYSITV